MGAVAVAALLVASGVIVYRVLAPAEVLDPAITDYPAAADPQPGALSRFPAAPLIVDGRLRIFATTRQVRADAPVGAPMQRTPYWAYRRWPARLAGVVATGTTVVTRWSDSLLVTIDAPSGRIRWRTAGPDGPAPGYVGRRTGAATVYAPPGLHTAGTLVLVSAGTRLRALDAATGATRWTADLPASCATGAFTTLGGRYVCAAGTAAYDVRTGRRDPAWPAGGWRATQPLACGAAGSDCAAMRTTDGSGRTRGWRLSGAVPVALPTLDPSGTWLAGDLVVAPVGGAGGPATGVVARSAATGAPRWRWRPATADPSAAVRVLAVQPGRVHLLNGRWQLLTLDASTGTELSRFVLAYRRDRTGWVPGHVLARDGFVAVERLADPAAADDDRYYFSAETVIMAGT